MDRNFNAPLSPSELASLRGLGVDSKREISSSHRQLLLSMGLVVANGDELILTERGRRRLDHEEGPVLSEGATNQLSPRLRMCGSAGGEGGLE
jgi:hypothetical protein